MSRMLAVRGLAALVLALVVPAAACSDDGGPTAAPSTTASTSSTTATSSATTSAAPTGDPADPTEPAEPAEPSALDGTAWLLRSIEDDGETVDVPTGGVPAVVTFGADAIDVYDGVNTVSGEYELDGTEVTIRMGRATDFPYPDEDLAQYEFIGRLATVERASLDGDELVLVQRDGARMTLEQALGAAPSG